MGLFVASGYLELKETAKTGSDMKMVKCRVLFAISEYSEF